MIFHFFISLIGLFLLSPGLLYSADSEICNKDNYSRIAKLYNNRSSATAQILFSILDCDSGLSKKTKRAQYVALIGGVMKKNPELIEDLYDSANKAKSIEAPKIFLDGLWICATKPCKDKLLSSPFSLPMKDIDALLKETPPDPYSFPITTPESIDFLWGYFISTGDIQIVKRIFGVVRSNWNSYNAQIMVGVNKRMLIESAKWSLVSMAIQHKLVKDALIAESDKFPEAIELLKEIEKESTRYKGNT